MRASPAPVDRRIAEPDDLILVTGATGFMGPPLVSSLLRHGFRNIRALARPSSSLARLQAAVAEAGPGARVEIVRGNLLSPDDCKRAARDAAVVLHLATGSDKSHPGAFMNAVVTTRNLLDACRQNGTLRRFLNVSSIAVYESEGGGVVDERCAVGANDADAYVFSKLKQDELLADYGRRYRIPYVIVRPGSVFGPGKAAITGRVGIDTFGMFLHLGGPNRIPLTYIDNCSDAIVLAGVTPGIDGQVFNIVDDDLPSSRQFLQQYKRKVKRFRSIYIPHAMSYALCLMWEKYSKWSEGQLPPAFNRRRWNCEWSNSRYSNDKLKAELGWRPNVSMHEALRRYFEGCREPHSA